MAPKRLLPWFYLLFLLLICVGSARGQNHNRNLPIPVEVAPVVKGSVERSLPLIGTVTPLLRAVVKSEIGGRIVAFKAQEGEYIKKGEPICRLDTARRLIDLAAVQAELERARAEYAKAEKGSRPEDIAQKEAELEQEKANLQRLLLQKKRIGKLFNKNMASEEEREDAYWKYEESRARVKELEAALAMARAGSRAEDIMAAGALLEKQRAEEEKIRYELGKASVAAPFSGLVVNKFAEMGEWLSTGDRVAELVNIEKVLIRTEVPEKEVGGIKEGQEAQLYLDAYPGRVFSGRVKQIIPQADLKSRNFPVKIEADNPEGLLLAGMFTRIKIPLARDEEALLLPKDALIRGTDGEYVFVLKGKLARKVKVVPGSGRGDLIAVAGDISAGDKVVVTNNESLRDLAEVLVGN